MGRQVLGGQEDQPSMTPAAPDCAPRDEHRHPGEPTLEASWVAELSDVRERFNEHVVEQIFDLRVRPKDANQEPLHVTSVGVVEGRPPIGISRYE